MNTRAQFTFFVRNEAVLLTDLDGPVSITNDAEAVVAYCLDKAPGRRVLYRDTDGQWDELKHDGTQFVGFAPLSADDRDRYAQYLS